MRILIVEDEVKIAQALRRSLESQHYTVDLAHEGETGLQMALEDGYDLLVLDVMLPKRDGVSICRAVRAEELQTPILMLTAKGLVEDKVAALDSGADDYLVKPFSLEEFFSRVRALMRRGAQTKSPVLQAGASGELRLDPVAQVVTVVGKPVVMSAKEFAVLEDLLRHQDIVVSKQTLVDHVWNYDTDVLPKTVEVHMKHLRDKIDRGRTTSFVETVRGFGYVIRTGKV